MDLFGFMYKGDEKSEGAVKTTTPTPQPQHTPSLYPTTSNPTPTPIRPQNIEVSQKMKTVLLEAMRAKSNQSFDYFKFQAVEEKLKEKIFDERLRFEAAGTCAMVVGGEKSKIVESIDVFLTTLETEDVEFQENLKEEQKRIESGNSVLAQYDAEIAQMRAKIQEFENKKTAILNSTAQDKLKIEATQRDFQVAKDFWKTKLLADKNNIVNFVQ